MDRKETSKILKDLGISPSLFNWGDDIIRCTEIWYDDETNELCSDCGVSVPVGDSLNIAKILIDLEDAIISHYKKYGISLSHSYIIIKGNLKSLCHYLKYFFHHWVEKPHSSFYISIKTLIFLPVTK